MPRSRHIKDPDRYKTVLCEKWSHDGECPYGQKCQFAHGVDELRMRPTQCQPVKSSTMQRALLQSAPSLAASSLPELVPSLPPAAPSLPPAAPSLPQAASPLMSPPPLSTPPSLPEFILSPPPAAPVSDLEYLEQFAANHHVRFESQCHIADEIMSILRESTEQAEVHPLPVVKRDISFATQSVLRTAAFVLDDSAGVTCFDDPAGMTGSQQNIWGPPTVPFSHYLSPKAAAGAA